MLHPDPQHAPKLRKKQDCKRRNYYELLVSCLVCLLWQVRRTEGGGLLLWTSAENNNSGWLWRFGQSNKKSTLSSGFFEHFCYHQKHPAPAWSFYIGQGDLICIAIIQMLWFVFDFTCCHRGAKFWNLNCIMQISLWSQKQLYSMTIWYPRHIFGWSLSG